MMSATETAAKGADEKSKDPPSRFGEAERDFLGAVEPENEGMGYK